MNLARLRGEIWFLAQRSQGAGGQHVNRTNSSVTLHWAYQHSSAVSDWEKARIAEKMASRINEVGEVQIRAESERDQLRNKELAFQRLVELLKECFYVPKKRIATKPSRSSQRKRLDKKTKHAEKKRGRSTKWS